MGDQFPIVAALTVLLLGVGLWFIFHPSRWTGCVDRIRRWWKDGGGNG